MLYCRVFGVSQHRNMAVVDNPFQQFCLARKKKWHSKLFECRCGDFPATPTLIGTQIWREAFTFVFNVLSTWNVAVLGATSYE